MISTPTQLHEILYAVSHEMLITIIYRSIALLQLLYRWQHQSGELWIPPLIFDNETVSIKLPFE
jgi:hypothetical protein